MAIWSKENLQDVVRKKMAGLKFIAVSNREPYIHRTENGRVDCTQPASGLTAAIDPIMRASGGVWVAHGSGSADRLVVDEHDRVLVPPEEPLYSLRRVWLSERIEREYYCGLANQGLWPLCHIAFHRPRFSQREWDSYRIANELFAQAVLEEAAGEPAFVFIQDYHFGLLPRMLKRYNPKLVVAQFWHIPWPNREAFRAFPWKEELLDGMLGNDLLGFHLNYHCANFLETVERNIEALVDTEHSTAAREGHTTSVRAFPISIDFDAHDALAKSGDVQAELAQWLLDLHPRPDILGIGIDRIDYTKGIPDRLLALDRLLEERPEYRGRLMFVQVGVPSRTSICDYQELNRELAAEVARINGKWQTDSWRPIIFVQKHVDQASLIALHLLADFCIVSSLHDGMNLVAKEFVASRFDGDGVLILSNFTGAARELTGALLINPFNPDEIAEAMHAAIVMPMAERRRRMERMRSTVESNNIYRWAGKIIESIGRIETPVDVADDAIPAVELAVEETAVAVAN
jgi:trehalose-6-phosphate synthase